MVSDHPEVSLTTLSLYTSLGEAFGGDAEGSELSRGVA